MANNIIQLTGRWELGACLGKGSYGEVFAATGEDGAPAAVKIVPKRPGASREMLLADLTALQPAIRNVVPVLDSGETENAYAIVMPLADESLRDQLVAVDGPLPLEQALAIMTDVATALADLDGRVVHRDLKPENVLLIDGRWCLTDFGISRYTEAVTATETHKESGTLQYAAPERWRSERATAATDVYALGVMAYELLTGDLPFPGPEASDFRHQHLVAEPPPLAGATPRLAALIEECLYKSPGARPVPANLLARLQKAADTTLTPGGAALASAYQRQAERVRGEEIAASRARDEQERRGELTDAARRSLERVSTALLETVTDLAPGALVQRRPEGWSVELHGARFGVSTPIPIGQDVRWDPWRPSFDIIAAATVSVVFPANAYGYAGRSHSLYYCDAQRQGAYSWFETAFMHNPILGGVIRGQEPFALHPADPLAGPEPVGKALANAMTEYQVAWPFTELVPGESDDFNDRWMGWFAAAADGQLSRPSMMPEYPTDGSWRRS
ncbi:serine/threonine-protein kinase [Modestobacter excelsi]|uniref:serine/threonine-protein kinase n=1 Tax=Modestobacter excelsi TaxID=2213161 RepID=UPI001C20D5B2|nr:serine/threonine-protein kinase [Modestobacter excelsi]